MVKTPVLLAALAVSSLASGSAPLTLMPKDPATIPGRAADCAGFPRRIASVFDERFPLFPREAMIMAVAKHEGTRVGVYASSTGCRTEPTDYVLERPAEPGLERSYAGAIPDYAARSANTVPVYILVGLDEPESETVNFIALKTSIPLSEITN